MADDGVIGDWAETRNSCETNSGTETQWGESRCGLVVETQQKVLLAAARGGGVSVEFFFK